MEKIDKFEEEYFFLSNFYEAPVVYGGLKYKSSEAAFQAQKCSDVYERKKFTNVTPSESKKMGRSVNLRTDWDEVKFRIMEEIVCCKFLQNPDLKKKLIDTGDAYLEEGNWWGDKIWGVCDGEGENNLGKALMKVRNLLKMKKLIVYQGIQGSGKSTMAKAFVLEDPDNRVRVNRDDIRLMLGKPFNPKIENLVTAIESAALDAAMAMGKTVVSDNMNMNPTVIKSLVGMAEIHGYDIEFRFVYTPLEVCIQRDSERQNPVGEQVIRNTYKRYKNFILEKLQKSKAKMSKKEETICIIN